MTIQQLHHLEAERTTIKRDTEEAASFGRATRTMKHVEIIYKKTVNAPEAMK